METYKGKTAWKSAPKRAGLSANAEEVVRFVRPHADNCARVLCEAEERLNGKTGSLHGYEGADGSAVRETLAAVFSAVKHHRVRRTAVELALLAAGCLEAAGLHPVLALGKSVGVGVWLYESCFLDPVSDDRETVEKYASAGVDHLCFFDADDLISCHTSAFSASERHFFEKLRAGHYDCFVDIYRCRMSGGESEVGAGGERPAPSRKEAPCVDGLPKNSVWERRLLDFTARNSLLNFTGKHALKIACADMDGLFEALEGQTGLRITADGVSAPKRERLERGKEYLHACADPKEAQEILTRLLRRDREADEETGAHVLYLAFGFLRYRTKEGKQQCAPLVLCPVLLSRAAGREEFALSCKEREYLVNSTLLEYLWQEFALNLRGLKGSALRISEILAVVRAETANLRGWGVISEVSLSTFSFQRYLMWNDLRKNMKEFEKNALVSVLLSGRMERADLPAPCEEDDGDPAEVLTPLPADSSQYAAVALAGTGASFVLHGPPGTGKSQTITNIVANALYHGKRVLFVAEKKAALDVVKRRLDGIGIGDFCLELHAGKADKGEIVRKIEHTLSLCNEEGESGLSACANELTVLREELKAPMRALHEKRRMGLSVYEAIAGYLKNKAAPDVVGVESAFYDLLTEERFALCKSEIAQAAAAARECGGVSGLPFEGVNLTEYSPAVRDRVLFACEALIAEVRHLKSYLALLLDFFRQKATFTRERLLALTEVAVCLKNGDAYGLFSDEKEEEFAIFFHANRRLDEHLDYYFKHFKSLVELKDLDALKSYCVSGGDWRLNRAAKSAAGRLAKVSLHPLDEEDVPRYLNTLAEIGAETACIGNDPRSAHFCDRAGNINLKKRAEYLKPLYELHGLCEKAFPDFNPDAFHAACMRASNGCITPVLEGFLTACEAFFRAEELFLAAVNGTANIRGDILDGYAAKAGALIDNMDMLAGWCAYRACAERLAGMGLKFVTEALESGRLRTENVLAGFEKNVCKNFLENVIPGDPALSRLTVGTLEETVEKFRLLHEKYVGLAREELRRRLISRLPREGNEAAELAAFSRFARGRVRGTGLRGVFAELKSLVERTCPCMLMSPSTVAQYLQPTADQFDLVIFDEASQLSTAEAIGSIARAKATIVVGDPKQLPPTSFFRSASSEDEPQSVDLESVLDDCLALGMPERHLRFHYRSRHESLIAFSNAAYYENRLCTFPSPEGQESRVRLVLTQGAYDRGGTKQNVVEAETLVDEVVRRLQDAVLVKKSIGVVTFSGAQQAYIERALAKKIAKLGLEREAYGGEEPLFVKNLENVQGDERDVILFSVGYGPNAEGKLSLGFGPLNQEGGWRRLNVAVSRAREETLVYASFPPAMIDLRRTSSRGVAGLKAFLEFAERGKMNVARRGERKKRGIGDDVARELARYGYDCRLDVGASDFKLDVCVVDPREKSRFILGILADGDDGFSVKDRNILQVQALKRGNWNLLRISSVSYYNNPKREIRRIKDVLDRLTGKEKGAGAWMARRARPYRAVKAAGTETAAFVTGGEHDGEIIARMREIVSVEEPISAPFLKKRLLDSFGIVRSGGKVEQKLDALVLGCGLPRERVMGVDYYYKRQKAISVNAFRTEEGAPIRKSGEDFTVFEMLALTRSALEDRVALYMDELVALACGVYPAAARSGRFETFVRDCVRYGEEKGLFVCSVSDRVSLA